ncbi:MAG: hypothetical protein RIF34_08020 [Candidatus Kapaibacterium sp.]
MTRILTILGLLLFGFTNQTATACSCVGEITVEGGYKSADIVTSGQVISIETEWLPDSTRIKEMVELGFPADSLDKRLNGYYLRKVLILVDTVYKGRNRSDTLTIYTGMGGGDCGFRFKEGQKYIIYGDTDSYLGDFFRDQEFPDGQNVYWTNICTRTQEHNRKEIKELEKLKNKNGR